MTAITLERLRELGACQDQLDAFRGLFGDSVTPTLDLCMAHASGFNWDWAARLLSSGARRAYEEARAIANCAYDEAKASAWFNAWSSQERAAA